MLFENSKFRYKSVKYYIDPQSERHFSSDMHERLQKNIKRLLNNQDKEQIQNIIYHYMTLRVFTMENCYNFITNIIDYTNINYPNIQKSIVINFTSLNSTVTYKKARGKIIVLNPTVISTLINKNRNFLRRFFQNPDYCLLISKTDIHNIIPKGNIADCVNTTFFNILNIFKKLNINVIFYFIKKKRITNPFKVKFLQNHYGKIKYKKNFQIITNI